MSTLTEELELCAEARPQQRAIPIYLKFTFISVCGNKIKALLLPIDGEENQLLGWKLPGTEYRDTLGLECFSSKFIEGITGIQNVYYRQVQTVSGDDNSFIRISYLVILPWSQAQKMTCLGAVSSAGQNAHNMAWVDANNADGLATDDQKALWNTLSFIRHAGHYYPFAFHFMTEKYSLYDLQEVYQVLLDKQFTKSNFRRKIENLKCLISCDEKQVGVSHRSALLYRTDSEKLSYLLENGLPFRI